MPDWLRDRREMAAEIDDLKEGIKALITVFDLMPPDVYDPLDKYESEKLETARKWIKIFGCPCRGWKI